jgi:GTP pyrophosphokinase
MKEIMAGLTARFNDALVYAAELHSTQNRKKTSIPYISHLLAVASIALEHGADEDEAIAGLLHDAVEDQGGPPTLTAIRERFGDKVAHIVHACSDTDKTPKPPWRERKEAYVLHVGEACPSVRLVSASDKLHNARAILADYRTHGEDLWPRFNAGGAEDVVWYYRSLVSSFSLEGGESTANPAKALQYAVLVRELDLVVTELENACLDETRSQ